MELQRTDSDDTLALFRQTVRTIVRKELVDRRDEIERTGMVHRGFWTEAGQAGMLCPTVPEAYGGAGLDFRFNAVVLEERAYAGSSLGTAIHSDIVSEYIVAYGTEE